MKKSKYLVILLTIVLSACGAPAATATYPAAENTSPPAVESTAPPTVEPTAAIPSTGATAEPAAPTFTILGVLNRDAAQAGQNPFLVANTAIEDGSGLWAVWAENSSGGVRQIFSSELEGEAFQARGASLNIHVNVIGDFPTITLAGENRSVPWSAWTEPSPGFRDVPQLFASRFIKDTGLWQQAGQDRGGGEASLNLQTNRPASHPFIFSGSGDPTSPPAPWVAWEETSINSFATQIFVAKGVKDESGDPEVIGGFRWEPVGILKASEPTLNVDPFRNSLHPTGVFAETANSVPWVTWHEEGGDRPSRIFTARGVADPNAPGGFKWINVPACQPEDEAACALNTNPLNDAKDAAMAAGSLIEGESTVPWIAWPELGQNGKWQVFVSRLDTASRNSFLQVGGSLNVDPNHDARAAYITFVGNVPYVGWLEDDGTGKFRVHVRHLASDPQTGTWVLDSPEQGFNQNPDLTATGPFNAAAQGNTLFLTWTEGDPASSPAQVVVGALQTGTVQP
ncbi:MAG: hypothetical protein EHM40_16000 [Chloroflexi bacterium]|nr:MAG: hypothetical protein EHM40_16000 [Chloroflexota bacterium]